MSFKLNLFKRSGETDNKALIVLIHGLGAPDTWGKWKERLLTEPQLVGVDIALADYETGHLCCPWLPLKTTFHIPVIDKTLAVGRLSGIKALAHNLRCELELSKFDQYDKVILLGHSMGGLIAAWYMITVAEDNATSKVVSYISIATPFNGSHGAVWYLFPGHSQISDLKPNSEFLDEFRRKLEKYKSRLMELASFTFIYAEGDSLVPPTSAVPRILTSRWQAQILPEGHSDVIKIPFEGDSKPYDYVLDKIKKSISSQRLQWLEKYLGDIKTVKEFWEEWTSATEPVMTEELLLNGRDEVVEKIKSWIKQDKNTIAISAKSKDEAILTFIALLNRDIDIEKSATLQPIFIILSREAWITTCKIASNVTLVPFFKPLNNLVIPKNCRVVVPFSQVDVKWDKDVIDVPKQSNSQFAAALEKIGVPSSEAYSLAEKTKSNLLVLRRRLAINPWSLKPAWSEQPGLVDLIPALLVGKWKENHEGDKVVISKLAGCEYDQYIRSIMPWLGLEEAPITKTLDNYEVVGLEDAWDYLYEVLTASDIANFEQCINDVFSAQDPTFDLEQDQWFAASIYDKKPNYSSGLYEGLATSLIMLALRDDRKNHFNIISTQGRVNFLIEKVYSEINTWEKWFTIAPYMQLFAEAAPEETLKAIEREINNSNSTFFELFRKTGDGIFGRNYYTHVLWALEILAWHPHYASRACMILADIGEKSTEFKIVNSPSNSLLQIFMPWHPQTTITSDERLEISAKILARYPETGWKLAIQLLPRMGGFASNNPKPKWRDWEVEDSKPISSSTYLDHINKISYLIIQYAGNRHQRWMDILDHVEGLRLKSIQELTAPLMQKKSSFVSREQVAIWNKLREKIGKHRKFATANWSLPKEIIDELERVFIAYEPVDTIERKRYLFTSYHPVLVNPIPYSKEDNSFVECERTQIRKEREQALIDIYTSLGEDGLLRLVEGCENDYAIGDILIRHVFNYELKLRFLMELLRLKKDVIVERYMQVFCDINGFDRLAEEVRGAIPSLGKSERDQLLRNLPFRRESWEFIDQFEEQVSRAYWQEVNVNVFVNGSEEIVIRNMIHCDRPYSALKFLRWKEEIEAELILSSLEACIVFYPKKELSGIGLEHTQSEIMDLFKYLYKVVGIDRKRLLALEWWFLPMLEYNMQPKVLFSELGTDPDLFVELICLVYKGDKEEKTLKIDEHERARARRAYELLKMFTSIPGFSENDIKPDFFRNWMEKALDGCRKQSHTAIGEQHLGTLLSFSPIGHDGMWPHEIIRDFIEEYYSEHLASGFEIGRLNQRGTYMGTGGRAERELSAEYIKFADSLKICWPRCSAILRSIAEKYKYDAKRENALDIF